MAQFTVSDYITIRDGSFVLNAHTYQYKVFPIDLPSNFVKGTNKAKPIIQFKLYVPVDAQLLIGINDQVQMNLIFHQHQRWVSIHELLDGSLFVPGETNEIRFFLRYDESEEGASSVGISDIVLFFKKKITI
jgi:hypothetical protein